MTKLTLLGAAAILSTALATPVMAQEATQEPGMIGFSYPNSHYLRGGYGTRLPDMAERQGFVRYYGPRVYGGYAVAPVGAYGPYGYGAYGYYGPAW
jgi:hypothetical protein